MFDITQLSRLSYFFDRNPLGDFILGYFVLGYFILLLVIAKVLKKKSEKNKYLKKSIKKKLWVFYVFGGIGCVLILSRFSEVPFISMRIWLYLAVIASIVLGVRNLMLIRRLYLKRIASSERETEKQKNKN